MFHSEISLNKRLKGFTEINFENALKKLEENDRNESE
jgi:hypothetical protein